MKTEKGITLLEVLLTLSILSFISIIVWNVFFQGLNFSSAVQKQTLLQQETHAIITALRKTHHNSTHYTIFYNNDLNSSSITIESDDTTIEFNNPKFQYELFHVKETENQLFDTEQGFTIFPSLNDLPIKVIVRDQKKPNLYYESQAYISKLRN